MDESECLILFFVPYRQVLYSWLVAERENGIEVLYSLLDSLVIGLFGVRCEV